MVIGFKAYPQKKKHPIPTNLTGQYNESTIPHPKNNPQSQTNSISRMRMAIGFKANRSDKEIRYTTTSYSNQLLKPIQQIKHPKLKEIKAHNNKPTQFQG